MNTNATLHFRVWKYPAHTRVALRMPRGARVTSVQNVGGEVFIWAVVDPREPLEERRVWWSGTGREIPDLVSGWPVYTIQDTPFIWHIFIEPSAEAA